jgi:putative GTP pyrophosphokinase
MLDDYRRSFGPAYESVIQATGNKLSLECSGRPAKSTRAIIEKLHRETIRLSQIQDIAGCRIVVPNLSAQQKVVTALRAEFPGASVDGRRTHGYRAVHVVVEVLGKLVEIQVRTTWQHDWAETSEKLSDIIDPAIKYGGGPEVAKKVLKEYSELMEVLEGMQHEIDTLFEGIEIGGRVPEPALQRLRELRETFEGTKPRLLGILRQVAGMLLPKSEGPQA